MITDISQRVQFSFRVLPSNALTAPLYCYCACFLSFTISSAAIGCFLEIAASFLLTIHVRRGPTVETDSSNFCAVLPHRQHRTQKTDAKLSRAFCQWKRCSHELLSLKKKFCGTSKTSITVRTRVPGSNRTLTQVKCKQSDTDTLKPVGGRTGNMRTFKVDYFCGLRSKMFTF